MMLNIVYLEEIPLQKKQLFLFKGHNSAKNHSTIKSIKYAKELEATTNPVTFHSNCISSIKEVVQTNLKMKIIKGT